MCDLISCITHHSESMDFLSFAVMPALVYYDITRHSRSLDSSSFQIAYFDIHDLSLFCNLTLESTVYILVLFNLPFGLRITN